jgi:hypothetical protein
VLEKTRGDLTLAIRQEQMRQALVGFEANLDRHLGTRFGESAPAPLLPAADDTEEGLV